jgi:hypothetical protein
MGATSENLTVSVRDFLSCRLIERMVKAFGMEQIFLKSKSWEGYNRACDSWHDAYWKWIDEKTPPNPVEQLKGPGDWSRVPQSASTQLRKIREQNPLLTEAEGRLWLLELCRQEMLQDRATFLMGMCGPEAQDPEFYREFAFPIGNVHFIGDDTYLNEIAKQKCRKPTEDTGDRRLKYQLLLCWIPGCLWAFTTDGMIAFSDSHYPRSNN